MRPVRDRDIIAALEPFMDGNTTRMARMTGIPRSTIRDWIKPDPRRRRSRPRPSAPDMIAGLPTPEYSYLLGIYLGDGTISASRRGVYRLRIVMDICYPRIITECVTATRAVMPRNRVHVQRLRFKAVEIGCSSKSWPILFPQHGPGPKHLRPIELAGWQREIVTRHPKEFVRGLIHSDGCRVLNHVNGKAYPRYFFNQVSDDIRNLFCAACRMIGVEYRLNRWDSVSIARAPSVAILDSFIGPKS
jgi:hypothetical protein